MNLNHLHQLGRQVAVESVGIVGASGIGRHRRDFGSQKLLGELLHLRQTRTHTHTMGAYIMHACDAQHSPRRAPRGAHDTHRGHLDVARRGRARRDARQHGLLPARPRVGRCRRCRLALRLGRLIGRELRGAEATAADEQSANFRERRGAESRCRCGPRPGANEEAPSPGADVAGVSPVPAQMSTEEPSPRAMWRGWAKVPGHIWQG